MREKAFEVYKMLEKESGTWRNETLYKVTMLCLENLYIEDDLSTARRHRDIEDEIYDLIEADLKEM